MQDYAKAHVVLPYQQKRRKQEISAYRMVMIAGPVGGLVVDAFRIASGDMPLTRLVILACVAGMAITLICALAVIWAIFRLSDKMRKRRRKL